VAKLNSTQSRDYAVERLTDGATTMVILDELTNEKKVAQGAALKAIDAAKELLSRNLDEDDYQMIRACAFASDARWQRFYRERAEELGSMQETLKTDPDLDTETRTRLILGCDRTIQAYCTLSLRGNRDLPVAFAPKAVLQNQNPPTEEEIEDEINGAL
jgi:hypothetical protein